MKFIKRNTLTKVEWVWDECKSGALSTNFKNVQVGMWDDECEIFQRILKTGKPETHHKTPFTSVYSVE